MKKNNPLKNFFETWWKDFKTTKSIIFRSLTLLISIVVIFVPAFILRSWAMNQQNGIIGNPNDFMSINICLNPGVGLSILNDAGEGLVYFIQALFTIVILIACLFCKRKTYIICLTLATIGGLTNLIDRALPGKLVSTGEDALHKVVDYFRFSFFNFTFNIADAYITTSIFILFVSVIVFTIIEFVKSKKLKQGDQNEKN